MDKYQTEKILLFDGVCNLCSGVVQFILKHEKENVLKFAALQSESGKQLLSAFGIDIQKTDSIVLIEHGKAYVKSRAAIVVSRYLKTPFNALKLFSFVPTQIGDWVYDIIAANRYRIFGKKEQCWVPGPDLRNRFWQ